MLDIGTRVKYTVSALKKYRDDWQKCGREPQKTNLRKYYENKSLMRGIILEKHKHGYRIVWDDETISDTISYHVENADE